MTPDSLGAALIGAFAIIIAASLPAWLAARRSKQRQESIAEAVGTPNGNGNLIQMQERMLGLTHEVLGWQQQHDEQDDERFKGIYARLDALELSRGNAT